ncbi:MAG: hypothetical protein EP332_07370 [Bacteroidetes bacterium]|nr:MAG: hypothetical protein EP332_07370 [Bacteroidota bacterium]
MKFQLLTLVSLFTLFACHSGKEATRNATSNNPDQQSIKESLEMQIENMNSESVKLDSAKKVLHDTLAFRGTPEQQRLVTQIEEAGNLLRSKINGEKQFLKKQGGPYKAAQRTIYDDMLQYTVRVDNLLKRYELKVAHTVLNETRASFEERLAKLSTEEIKAEFEKINVLTKKNEVELLNQLLFKKS